MTRYIVRKSDDGETLGRVGEHSWDVFKIDDDGFESCLANTDTRAEARKIRDEYKGSDK